MPKQELFFEREAGSRRVEVLKIYDVIFAREAFAEMGEAARAFLWKSLRIDEEYEASDLPAVQSAEGEDLLWNSLIDQSREDGNSVSFFLVNEANGTTSKTLFVSPDWPSAEQYAQNVLVSRHV